MNFFDKLKQNISEKEKIEKKLENLETLYYSYFTLSEIRDNKLFIVECALKEVLDLNNTKQMKDKIESIIKLINKNTGHEKDIFCKITLAKRELEKISVKNIS